jgi:hypothetical protein
MGVIREEQRNKLGIEWMGYCYCWAGRCRTLFIAVSADASPALYISTPISLHNTRLDFRMRTGLPLRVRHIGAELLPDRMLAFSIVADMSQFGSRLRLKDLEFWVMRIMGVGRCGGGRGRRIVAHPTAS